MRRTRVLGALLFGAALLWSSGRPAGAATSDALFEKGNDAFEAGRYEEAAEAYRTILEYGVRDPRAHYNLANASFKLGRLGQAILHYERALRLDPGDREARDNLALARGMIRDRITPPEIPYPVAVLRGALDRLSLDAVTLMFLALYGAGAGLIGALILARDELRRRVLAYAAVLVCVGAFLAGGAFVWKVAERRAAHAIVLQDRADVRSGPAEDNTVLFTVHEGTRLEVRSARDGWYQVSLPNALSGWIRASTVEQV